ncbi:DUF2971 domain-containing protein [Caballeronia sp. M23-90]
MRASSTLDETNDPFELMGASIGKRRARQLFKVVHDHWTQTIGMLCMGTAWDNPVMWAHYGQKHQGVCIGFDLAAQAQPQQVTYAPDLLKGLLDHLGDKPQISMEQLTPLLTTKFKDWGYEREWRIFADLAIRAPEDGKCYLNFDPHMAIREVILGARCPASVSDLAALVNEPQKVEVFKARAAFDSFRVVRQKQIKPIIVKPRS